jgi:hypothetical protein
MRDFGGQMVSDVGLGDTVEEECADRTPEVAVDSAKRPALEVPFALTVYVKHQNVRRDTAYNFGMEETNSEARGGPCAGER